MSDHQPTRSRSPKRSSSLARVNRSSNDLSLSGHRDASGRPASRMNAPAATKRLPKRSQSFKRTSINHGAMAASSGTDLASLANLESSLSKNQGPMRSRSGRSDTRRLASDSSGRTSNASTEAGGFATTSFVKNFLDEDDQDVLGSSQNSRGQQLSGSKSGLQFDAETQRNVHRSLLSPSDDSPESPRKSLMTMSSSHSRRSHGTAPPQQNLFHQRDDFYNVDQSVNLMDAEVGKYESKKSASARGPASMVEIFLKDSGVSSSSATDSKRRGKSLFPRPDNWERMSAFEKLKDILGRLLVPVFCCCIFAMVILTIVTIYHGAVDTIEGDGSGPKPAPSTPKPTSAPETAVPEAIEVPQDAVLDTQGMSANMKAISQALVEMEVVKAEDLSDTSSAAYKALDWISTDKISLAAVPNAARKLQVSGTQERMLQRYVLAVAYYSWNGMTAKAEDLSAAAFQNMDDLGGSTQPAQNMAEELWLSDISECSWKGVECHPHASSLQMDRTAEATQIRALNLTGHGLRGTLPPQLTALRHLIELDLRDNSLSGKLDDIEWKNWDRMEYLLLGGNMFSGTIPNDITALLRAIDIDLGENQFEGQIPPLTGGQLKMSTLESLFIDNNQLTGSIPESFLMDMPNLSYLDLTANHLTGALPPALAQMTELRFFRAVNNSLTGNLPEAMAGMERLDTLALDNNKFSGNLPVGIFGQTKRLRFIHLSGNYFGGPLPDSVAGLDKLNNLHLSGNQFTGTIPESWFQGTKVMKSIRLDKNQLTGGIPASVSNLASSLEDFRVSENKLQGELPDEMGDLAELRTCNLDSNGFSASIPDSWVGMLQLENMLLMKNSLTGSVPSDLCAMEKENEGTDLPISISADCESGDITCDCCVKCY